MTNYKVSLNQDDSNKLDLLSTKLNTSKKDVIKKALKMIQVYADNNEDAEISMVVKDKEGKETKMVII